MKKFLLFSIIFIFCFSINSYSNVITNSIDLLYNDSKSVVDTLYHDGKGAIGTVYSDVKSSTASVYPDIKEAVVAIGKAIGVAAEHVYSVLVKKYIVIGIKELCWCLFGFIILIIGFIGWKKATPIGQPITYRVIPSSIMMFVGLIIVCTVNYDDMLMGLINPEYGAINYILEYTKEIVN